MTARAGPAGQAVERGYEAYNAGKPITAAVEEDAELRPHWRRGWSLARQEAEREKSERP